MIIKKMKAGFGCLDNAEMQLHEGLNIITSPNGSGKSTWCAFIRCMLYGVDSTQREKGGVKPDKLKYAPWSGAAMAGSMEIEHDGSSITLSRSTKTAAAPMREFSAVYSGTAQKVPGLTGKDAGELLTGMPRAVFESSVFLRQSGLAVQNGPELEKRINAIISSGEDEGVAFSDADAALRAWLRKRKHNNSGAIPAAEAELASLQRSLDAADGSAELMEQLDGRIARAEEQLELLSARAESEGLRRGEENLRALSAAREAADRAGQSLQQAVSARAALQSEIENSVFQGKSPQEAEAVILPELEEYARRDKRRLPRPLVFALLALGLAAVLFAGSMDIGWLYIPGAAVLAASIFCAFLWRYRDNHYIGWGKMLEGKYGSENPEQLRSLIRLYEEKCQQLETLKSSENAAREEQSLALSRLQAAERAIVNPDRSPSAALEGAKAELELLRRRRAETRGRLEAMGDPMVTKSKKYDLQSRLSELRAQYAAISLAIDTLRLANDEMQQRFSPRLGQRAAEIMAQLTGGAYDTLRFDRSLAAEAGRPGDTVTHSSAFLSAGTADQLYLALRLAICELALPEGESCPLILDDALVNFDEERMGRALDMLQKLAEKRQIILFTCHDREQRYLDEKSP